MSRSNSADLPGGKPAVRRGWQLPEPGLRLAALLIVLLLGLHALGRLNLPPIERLDLALYDLRLNALASTLPDPRIVLVDIDERALARHGRWPWPRSLLAEVVDRIGEQQARVLALDLVLAEPDNSSGLAALDQLARGPLQHEPALAEALRRWRPPLDNDAQLAATLGRWPVVLGFMLSSSPGAARSGSLPAPVIHPQELAGRDAQLQRYAGLAGNLPTLQAAARQAGHLNALLDVDGKLRRVPLLAAGPDGQAYASLALATARRWLMAAPGADSAPPALRLLPRANGQADLPLQGVALGPAQQALTIRLGQHGDVLVPFRRTNTAFARWSAADVLSGSLPAGSLAGKAVVVGVSAPGLVDERMTPVSDSMQGSLVHASLLSGLLDGELRTVPPLAPLYELACLVLLALLLVWGLQRLGMVLGGLLTLLAMLAVVAGNAAAWAWGHWALPLAGPLLLPLLLFGLHMALAYRAANGARSQLTQLFGQYVPPELVSEMSRQPERYTMNSRSAELTVLFADVQGFSGMAERLPPAELSALMNALFSHLTDTIRAHRGTLDKYIGDSVMAFWGAPLDDPRHVEHAVAAALAMRARLPAINAEFALRGWPTVDVQIGVNTGSMVVGDMGSRHRRAYTVLGDAVNLAARLQQQCSRYGLGILVGHRTQQALPGRTCLALGSLPLRGREQEEPVWLPLADKPGAPADADAVAWPALWQAMRAAADAGQISEALHLLGTLEPAAAGAAPVAWQRAQLQQQLLRTGDGGFPQVDAKV